MGALSPGICPAPDLPSCPQPYLSVTSPHTEARMPLKQRGPTYRQEMPQGSDTDQGTNSFTASVTPFPHQGQGRRDGWGGQPCSCRQLTTGREAGRRSQGPGRAGRPPQAGSVALSSPTPPRGSPHTQPRVCPRSQLWFSTSSSLGFRGKTQVTAHHRTEMKRCSRDRTDLGEFPPGQGRAEAGHWATTESPRQVSWARCAPCLACPRLGSPTGLLIPFL